MNSDRQGDGSWLAFSVFRCSVGYAGWTLFLSKQIIWQYALLFYLYNKCLFECIECFII